MRDPAMIRFDDEELFLIWERRQPERYELHHGFAFAFSGGTLDHARIAVNVIAAFDRVFALPCRAYGSDVKVRVAARNFYYPDVTVVCHEVPGGDDILMSPRFVAEVLSPTTRRIDLVEKRAAYRALDSLDAYLIVHVETRRVEVDHRDPEGRWYTSIVDDGTLPIAGGEITLASLYERTSLAVETNA